jgi:hypothetical protein
MNPRKFTLQILLIAQTLYCWWCFFEAKVLPYDENYAILIQAVLISIAAWVIIRIIKAKWFGQIQISSMLFWSWFVVGSPLTFMLALIFYNELFGALAL